MDKLVKKGLEFGVGMASITVKALDEALNKLEKDGKINKKEGEKMVKDMVKKYQAQSDKYMDELQSEVDKFLKSNPYVTKKEIKAFNATVKKDIADINARIGKMSKPSKKSRK